MASQSGIRWCHRLPGFFFSSPSEAYRLKRSSCNGDFILELDEKTMRKCLDAQGISEKYQQKIASILKASAEDITTELRFKLGPGYVYDTTVPRAAFNYFIGISSIYFAVNMWIKVSKNARKIAEKKAKAE